MNVREVEPGTLFSIGKAGWTYLRLAIQRDVNYPDMDGERIPCVYLGGPCGRETKPGEIECLQPNCEAHPPRIKFTT